MNMLQLDRITKRFTDGQQQLTVLDGLCLQVDEGVKTCKVVATINNLTTGSFSFQGTGELVQVTTT